MARSGLIKGENWKLWQQLGHIGCCPASIHSQVIYKRFSCQQGLQFHLRNATSSFLLSSIRCEPQHEWRNKSKGCSMKQIIKEKKLNSCYFNLSFSSCFEASGSSFSFFTSAALSSPVAAVCCPCQGLKHYHNRMWAGITLRVLPLQCQSPGRFFNYHCILMLLLSLSCAAAQRNRRELEPWATNLWEKAKLILCCLSDCL